MPARENTGAAPFPNTLGSALIAARSAEPASRSRAWNVLMSAYWKPAYKHVRMRWRAPRDDAQDLIQGFFERAFERNDFADYDASRGRFRTYFRVCLDRYVSNEHKFRSREKRGGCAAMMDFDAAERELGLSDAAAWSAPDACFDREFQRATVGAAVDELRALCSARDRRDVFAAFEAYDLAQQNPRPTYDAIAQRLGIPVTTVTNHLAFARRELRRLVTERLREISGSDDELSAEVRAIFGGSAR